MYKENLACLKDVEESLQCFGVYPQIIRLAVSDKYKEGSLKHYLHDRYVNQVDVVYNGFSVHL